MNYFKVNGINKACCGLLMLVLGMMLSACMKTNAMSMDTSKTSIVKVQKVITDNTLKMVNATFYQTFVLGDWRYKGAQDLNGKINAYIQIPIPMDMSQETQKRYLQKAICPSSAHANLWTEIEGIPLNIHIYTDTKKHSIYVTCVNPLA